MQQDTMPKTPKKPKGEAAAEAWERKYGKITGKMLGGNHSLSEFEPIQRKFGKDGKPHPRSGDDKRDIDVRVETYRGISPGASHYYVTIREEHNSVLMDTPEDPYYDGPRWYEPSGKNDPEGEGKSFHQKFDSKYAAEKATREFIAKNFSRETHHIGVMYGAEDAADKKWFPKEKKP